MRDYDLRTSTKNAAGDFDFRGVPPGSYEVTVEAQSLRGRTPIVVGAFDLEGVRVALAPGADIKFRIVAERADKPDLSGLGVFLTANGRSGFGPRPLETERFTIRNVPPDHYALKIFGSPLREFYVKTGSTKETDVLTGGLTVTGAGTIDIEIVLASDGGAVQGVVRDKNQQPVSGATILLAPEPDGRSRADLFKNTTSDQDGHYDFAAIASGNYKLFAWDDVVEPEAWNDPEFLKEYEKQGQKVVLEPRRRTLVDLHVAIRPNPQE
jgi:hypothetical protein